MTELCGCSSVARTSGFQPECRGFESHHPLRAFRILGSSSTLDLAPTGHRRRGEIDSMVNGWSVEAHCFIVEVLVLWRNWQTRQT